MRAAELRRVASPRWNLTNWQALLSVYVDHPGSMPAVPMLGTYRIDHGAILFEPQFALERGITYRATLNPRVLRQSAQPSSDISASFRLSEVHAPASTEVVAIYPSSDIVPENLLKFYVHFSSPMSRGDVYDHITLRHSSGKLVELPFLEIGEELWDRDMTRLTLLFDPGRIKRGVRPLGEVGSSLEAGETYSLTIGHELRDAHGNTLTAEFTKAFRVGPAERNPIDVAKWKISAPASGSREPLRIDFPKPLDRALAVRFIVVANEAGEPVNGQSTLSNEEKTWSFKPDTPWMSTTYVLLVQPILEDLAGNNIGKSFDVDLFEGIQKRVTADPVRISFRIQ